MVSVYREAYGMFACNGIMFNHESPRRGENFVTRKICRAAAAIKLGLEQELVLGDLSASRDWGDARDFVRGMWLALQHATAEDFVFATGKLHSVRDLVSIAFDTVGLDWTGRVRSDSRFLRQGEPSRLLGNAAKARSLLHWQPTILFDQMIREMTLAELKSLESKQN
jgi:GDPmannose 4,6-dehydratase